MNDQRMAEGRPSNVIVIPEIKDIMSDDDLPIGFGLIVSFRQY